MNRPIQVGFALLDLSKHLMYDFHYNTWMKKFPNPTLLFTDTDSLAYEIVGHDLYAGMRFVVLRPKLYSFDYERKAHFDCRDGVVHTCTVWEFTTAFDLLEKVRYICGTCIMLRLFNDHGIVLESSHLVEKARTYRVKRQSK